MPGTPREPRQAESWETSCPECEHVESQDLGDLQSLTWACTKDWFRTIDETTTCDDFEEWQD